MSEHNIKTINMYNSGGALEYIQRNEIDPETESGRDYLIMLKVIYVKIRTKEL